MPEYYGERLLELRKLVDQYDQAMRKSAHVDKWSRFSVSVTAAEWGLRDMRIFSKQLPALAEREDPLGVTTFVLRTGAVQNAKEYMMKWVDAAEAHLILIQVQILLPLLMPLVPIPRVPVAPRLTRKQAQVHAREVARKAAVVAPPPVTPPAPPPASPVPLREMILREKIEELKPEWVRRGLAIPPEMK